MGVLIIRTIVYWDVYWGTLIFWKLPHRSRTKSLASSVTALELVLEDLELQAEVFLSQLRGFV